MTVSVNRLAQIYPHLVQHLANVDEEYLAGALSMRRVEAGERLLTYGEPSDTLMLIAEGDLRITLPSDKDVVDLGTRGSGTWVGELGMIDPGPASASVDAASDATLWELSNEAFEKMRCENPCAAARVMEEISKDVAHRLRQCNTVRIEEGEDGRRVIVPADPAEPSGFIRLFRQIREVFSDEDARASHATSAPDAPGTSFTLESFVDEHPSFGRLSAEDRALLLHACELKTYPDGHAFIREGEARSAVYLILEGMIEVTARKAQAASFTVTRHMLPGEIIGLIALLDRGPRSATCRAHGSVKVAVMALEGASLLMNTRAPISCAFQYALANQLANDARSLNESLLHATYAD